MNKRVAVRTYRLLSAFLLRLNSSAAKHISRRDNNRVFDMAMDLRDIADRIEADYDV